MDKKQELLDEWYKYAVWVKASGIHGADLLKAYADFWIGNIEEKETATIEKRNLDIKGNLIDYFSALDKFPERKELVNNILYIVAR